MSSHRPFGCGECSQTFTRNENLARHIRTRHGSQPPKPFRCCYCQTRFARRDVCKRHAERCRSGLGNQRQNRQDSHYGDEASVITNPEASIPSPPDPSASTGPRGPGYRIDNLAGGPAGVPSGNPTEDWPQLLPPETGLASPEVHVAAYFEHFHPSFPLLHQPTFDGTSPKPLRSIVYAIGSLYTAQKLPDGDRESYLLWSQSLWTSEREELIQLVGSDGQGLRTPWILQAWLLFIIYGIYMGEAAQFDEAKQMFHSAVSAVRQTGLLRRTTGTNTSASPAVDGSVVDSGFTEASGDENPQQRWMAYIEDESMKLCLHALFFLDFQIFSPCNMRPLMSPMELGWELPLPALLWDADSAYEWQEKLEMESCVTGLQKEDDHPTIAYPCPATKSLTLAMQSLMSSSPSPYLLAALSASPMALLFVVNNIDALLKDFTRSYYQLPPNLTDPSAFHILTQSQNRQFSTALGLIVGIVKSNEAQDTAAGSTNGASRAIWTTVERMSLAIKLSLCKPDSLLISGIVENSVAAGLATATHLALGLYGGARRSLQSLMKLAAGEDTMLVMLDELTGALQAMTHGDRRVALGEAPWAVVVEYRILLEIWRSLRWSSAEIQDRGGNRNENGDRVGSSQPRPLRRSEACVLVYNSIAEAILGFGEGPAAGRRHSIGARPSVLVAPPDLTESCFTKSILQFWKDRSVWDLGRSMVNIVEELISADSPATVLVIGGGGQAARRPSRNTTEGV